MDTVTPAVRSKIMASVKQKNTSVEILLRRGIHRRGLRYKLHDRSLPGSPDLVFPRFKAVVFVHGCYWHSHGCHRSTVPKSRVKFWKLKFSANRRRDERKKRELLDLGWRVLTIWECSIVGKTATRMENVAKQVETWLRTSKTVGEIGGLPFKKTRCGIFGPHPFLRAVSRAV